ncbi:aspartate/glutamate racemase family protein [Paenarthrobacter sp. NPDC057981]|uniref:aspartate/glutamate racemase family protein n=1 Tax=Paenarthrobacter sp. NPDC057981 TaxID=3346297 RepID=UPI0036DD1CBD
MKIWYQSTLDFDHQPNYKRTLNQLARRAAAESTEVVVRGRPHEFGNSASAVSATGSPIAYHSIVAPAFLHSLVEAEKQGADVFVAASFSEPILSELRSLATIPVVSMSEGCFTAAALLAPKIGLVTLNEHVPYFLEKSISLHKWKDRISGIHLLAGLVVEEDLDAALDPEANPDHYLQLIREAGRSAIASGAQVIVLAEGVLGALAAINGLSDIDGVPVIDVVGSTVLYAELAAALCIKTGVSHSRRAYPAPDDRTREYIVQQLAKG